MRETEEKDCQRNKSKERRWNQNNPSRDYIAMICRLYGDAYDDREEDSKIKGLDWEPGLKARHKSIGRFQKELDETYGIHLSKSKIQKILISGQRWTTERSREVQYLYEEYTEEIKNSGRGMNSKEAIRAIAKHLEISDISVIINLPYEKVVYDLAEKSANAKRIEKHRRKRR